MKKHLRLISIALCTAAALSCQEKEQVETIEKVEYLPAVTWINPEDAEVIIPAGSTAEQYIGFKSDFKQEELTIECTEGKDWCSAQFAEEGKIMITPSDKAIDENKKAIFCIKGVTSTKATTTVIVNKPSEVTFSVSREELVNQLVPVIRFVDGSDTFKMEPGNTHLEIAIESKYGIELLGIKERDAKTWCTAEFKDDKTIVVTASRDDLFKNMEADFIIDYKGDTKAVVEIPSSVSFKVSRKADSVKITGIKGDNLVRKENENGKVYYEMNVPSEGGVFKASLESNVPQWSLKEEQQEKWYSFTPEKGKVGEEVTFEIDPETNGMERAAEFVFHINPFPGDMHLLIRQAGKLPSEIERVDVYQNGMTLENGCTLQLDPIGGIQKMQKIKIVSRPVDAGIDFMFYRPGTDTADPEGENIASVAMLMSDPKATHGIIPERNMSGKERKTDLVMVCRASGAVKFRIHLIQPSF